MNRKLGMISSLVTMTAVLVFAFSMLIDSNYGSFLSSMFIAWGFVPMICSLSANRTSQTSSFGYTAVAFASIYAAVVITVYFTQLTVVHAGKLNPGALRILDYNDFGLFFAYDLLGYAFMALSTFFIAFTLKIKTEADKVLRVLLWVHGIFAIICVILPMVGVFSEDTGGGDLIGVLVLEFWCAYFTPVCILSFLHLKHQRTHRNSEEEN